MSECVSLGDRGIDLVLGGGLRRVRRTEDKYASVLLVRGPGGSGKTLVGFHAACELSKVFRGPIAYACIELLPTELEAQVRAWRTDLPQLQIRHRESTDAVNSAADAIVVEASVIDVAEGPDSLGVGLEHFVERLAREGRPPGVLVIDSLIDGYRIGSSASREFVDSVCKLAALWGIALVLLEECAPGAPSPWIFAADTVLELGPPTEGIDTANTSASERRLWVAKHRFGPSDAGPHHFLLEPGMPPQVLPRPSAWLESWTKTLLPANLGVPENPRRHDPDTKLEIPVGSKAEAPPLGLVVAVFGSESAVLHRIARQVPHRDGARSETLDVSFSVPLGENGPRGARPVLGVAHPYLSAHRFVRLVLDALRTRQVRRIVIADLRAVRSCANSDELRRAVGVICLLARRMGIAVAMVESTATRMQSVVRPDGQITQTHSPGAEVPLCVDFAELSIEVSYRSPQEPRVLVTDLRTGRAEAMPPSRFF